MSSYPSQSNRQPKLSNRVHHIEPAKPIYSDHHAIVSCDCCNRTMVPRVVSYYGQPLKSICPFCGTTFMKFPSGVQRFIQNFHTSTLSFDAFIRIACVAVFFGLLWFVSEWGNLSDNVAPFATFGTIIFAAIALAELVYQCVEQMAARLSQDSLYYWVALVLIAAYTANARPDLCFYIVLFSVVMMVRWIIAGFAAAKIASRSTKEH